MLKDIKDKSLQELAQDALAVQNACNPTGIVNSFHTALVQLHRHTENTKLTATHPITILWLDKLNSLAGIQSFVDSQVNEAISKAFDEVYNLAKTEG